MFLGLRLLNAGTVICDSYILHYHFSISVNGQNAVVLLVISFCYKRCVNLVTPFTMNGITDVFYATARSAFILRISVKCSHFQLLTFVSRLSPSHITILVAFKLQFVYD